MKLKGIRNEECREGNEWAMKKLVYDHHHQMRLMDIIDESSFHHFLKSGQPLTSHGQHSHHSHLFHHPLTTSIITLVIIVTLFLMMSISSACNEDAMSGSDGSDSLRVQKRSTIRGCGDEGHKDMCERCSKVTRSTVIFVGCCEKEPETKNYCMDLLGIRDQGRARRDLRLPAVWIRVLRR